MDFQGQRTYANQNNHFMNRCGITITYVGQDQAEATLIVTSQDLNPGGTLHGGALYTLADVAATAAARTNGYCYVTIEGSIHYHRAVSSGIVRASASLRHRGRSVCTAVVEITDENGRLLADAVFSIFRLDAIDHPAFQTQSIAQ